jgi:hypothetical protein
MKTNETENKKCKKCGALVDWLAVFLGGICVTCHEKRFNAEVARTGRLPRPNFGKAVLATKLSD